MVFALNLKAQNYYDFYDTCVTGQRLYFSILSDNSVAVVGGGQCDQDRLTGDMIIPSNVMYDGISYSVTSIGNNTFQGCSGLTSLTIPNSVTSIGDGAFQGCSGLTSLTIPNTVTSIGNYAFYGCSGLTSLTIPNSVISIGDYAFSGCTGLTSLTIPNSVISIGDYAFSGCTGLTSIVVETGNPVYDSRDNCNAIIRTADNTLVDGCQTTVIPNSITSIGDGAFSGCTGLTSLTIPNSVTSISDYAFSGCTGLTSIVVETGNPVYDSRDNCNAIIRTADNTLVDGCQTTVIPNSVTSIGYSAFYDCSSLTLLTIPNSVTSIGGSAFSGCTGLTSLTIPNSVTSIGDFAFYGCSGLTSLTILNSVTNIGIYTFYGCSGLTSLTIPNSVTSIGNSAFRGCSGLTSLTIPNSVTSIGDFAFYGCSRLTSLTIPNSITSIGGRAFYGCTGLTSIVVETGNPVYDSRDNCNAIIRTADNTLIVGCHTTVIPNSVTSIGDGAFFGYTGLTSLTIPNSVTSMGSYAFSGCSGLTTIVVETGNPVYDSRDNCNAIIRTADNTLIVGCLTTVIPNSVTSIGDFAFYGCSGLTSLTIPNTVTYIGNHTFYGCTGLTSLTIPNSVTSIGNYAFYGCSGLTSLTIPNSVTSIGYFAFYGCSDLTTIIFEGTTPPALAECFSTTFPVSNDLTIYVPVGSQEDYEASFGPAASDINIIESNVGIENIDHTSAMTVYPNPTTGVVNVECTMNNVQEGTVKFQLFDAFGRLLRTINGVGTNNDSPLRTARIDFSHYASGVYFIKAVADGKVMAVRKVVKN